MILKFIKNIWDKIELDEDIADDLIEGLYIYVTFH